MLPLATIQQLSARLGREFTGAELERAEALLDDASALVRDVAGRTWIDPDTGALESVPGSIQWVVLRAAERAIRNPDGFSSESAGDYSYQRTGVEPGVYLTAGEEKAIRRALGKTGLWTQPVTRGEDYLQTVWLNDSFGAEPFPYDVYRGPS